VTLLAVNYISDRFQHKSSFIIASISTAIVGYIVLMAVEHNAARMTACCLVVAGIFPAIILVFAWANTNSCGYTKRAASWAVAGVFAQGFSIAASQVYTDPPRYLKGHGVMIAFLSWSLINTIAARWWMQAENARKDRVEREYQNRGDTHPHYNRTLEDEGDGHINFRFVL
jgi:hypothetical protein